MPNEQWPGTIVTPRAPAPAAPPPASGGWPGTVVQAAAPPSYGDTLSRTTGISETPWYAQGMFGGYGPSVTDVIDTLPAVGGAVGGVLGAGSGAFASLGLGTVPGAVGGAAFGGEAGEAARQNVRRAIGAYAPRTSGEAATNIGHEGGIQAAAELGGRVMAKGASAAFSPGAGMVDQGVAAAEARLGANGLAVDMPAAARSTSRQVAVIEALAAKGVGGREATERYLGATNSLTAMADHTVARASKLTDASARGSAIADGMDAFKQNWIKQKNKLYGDVNKELPGLTVETPKTLALLDEVLKEKGAASRVLRGGLPPEDGDFFYGLWKGLAEDGHVSATDLRAAIRELDSKVSGAHADPFAAANKSLLQKLSATLDEEFLASVRAQAPNTAAKLEAANAVYADGIGKINSTYGKQIHKYAEAGQYDRIAQSVANSRTSVADIPRIMEVAGAEGTEAMRAAVLADLVSKAKNPQGALTPGGLQRAMKNFGEDRLSAILEPEQLARMKDIATLTASLQKGQKIMEGSQTAFLLSNMNLIGLIHHIGGSPVRRFLASPVGQRWMTTGYKPFSYAATKTAATRAAHAATYPLTPEDPE